METVVQAPVQAESAQVASGGVLREAIPMQTKKEKMILVLVGVVIVLAGIGTGFLLSGGRLGGGGENTLGVAAPGAIKSQKEAGIGDEETFKDSAEGKLEEGGIDGEGTHHLVRDGGPSQNVYLTSTVIDLGSFKGKKVKVWGQTISARKAGWLMDVGKIRVVE